MALVRSLLIIKIFFTLFIAVAGFSVQAKGTVIELIAGLAKPPFIVEEGKSGLQLDLVKAAFATQDIRVNFTHMPPARSITGLQKWGVDGVITLPAKYEYPGVFVSKPYIDYQNVVVSLSSSKFNIQKIEDLAGKQISAFQNARKFMPNEYKKLVNYQLDYSEVADQFRQVYRLFAGQTEVIILDVNIFRHIVNQQHSRMFRKPYEIHPIFAINPYAAGFKSEAHKVAFEQGIEVIKENGTYQSLVDKYLNL